RKVVTSSSAPLSVARTCRGKGPSIFIGLLLGGGGPWPRWKERKRRGRYAPSTGAAAGRAGGGRSAPARAPGDAATGARTGRGRGRGGRGRGRGSAAHPGRTGRRRSRRRPATRAGTRRSSGVTALAVRRDQLVAPGDRGVLRFVLRRRRERDQEVVEALRVELLGERERVLLRCLQLGDAVLQPRRVVDDVLQHVPQRVLRHPRVYRVTSPVEDTPRPPLRTRRHRQHIRRPDNPVPGQLLDR